MANEMAGKTVLVTGATQGIGRASAKALAQLGARVGIVGRDAKRTEETAAMIRAEVPAAQVDTFLADLSLMSDVRKLAEEVKAKYSELHVLLNNAGAIFTTRGVTKEGLEQTFALNHMSYFLLTNLLTDLLKKSAPARVVNVSSDAHPLARLDPRVVKAVADPGGSIVAPKRIDIDDLQSERSYSPMAVYAMSKAMNILFTRELSRRIEGTGVTANCLHPGVIQSGFGHNNGGFFGWLVKIGGPFLSSPEKGARTSVYLCSSDEGGRVSGQYFKNRKVAKVSAAARNDESAKVLWEKSAQIAGI